MFNARKYGVETIDQMAKLWAKGLSVTLIGQRLGVPKNSICRMAWSARKAGDPRFPKRQRGRIMSAKLGPPAEARVRKVKAPVPVAVALTLPSRAPGEHPMLVDLRPNECKWPVHSGPEKGEHYFCAALQLPGSPYCQEHAAKHHAPRAPIRYGVKV